MDTLESGLNQRTHSLVLADSSAVSTSSLGSAKALQSEAQIIHFEPNDPECPYNWSFAYKCMVFTLMLCATLLDPINGTGITVAGDEIGREFNIDDSSVFTNSYWDTTAWTLGGALVVVVGLPVFEDTGLRWGYLAVHAIFELMVVGQAVAQNYATLVVTRFFSGGCVALLANSIASVIPDLWETDKARSLPVSLYILLYVIGDTIGPAFFGGVMQHIGNWRWIFYIQLIIYGALFPLFLFFLPETRHKIILQRRAKKLRAETGIKYQTEEETKAIPLRQTLRDAVMRPPRMFFTEPVLFFSTLWSAFALGTAFLFTQSVEQVFSGLYGWSEWSCGYVQGAVCIGQVIGWAVSLYGLKLYLRSADRNDELPGEPIPEARLYVSVFGSFFGLSGGMFVYAWTSYPWLPWIAPAIGLGMVGFGIMIVVGAVADYVTDAYAGLGWAGSALAVVAFGENIFCGFLPLASESMYTNLGYQWASSLLGFLALALSFAPVVFIIYGRRLRERSPIMKSGSKQARDLAGSS